jgi:hypothetical protein
VRKNKIIGRSAKKASQPNAATKCAIREAQLRERLETFGTFSDWAKTVRKITRGSVARTQNKK